MPVAPVTPERVEAARLFGIRNAAHAAAACREAGLPFWAACALLEKESMGRNVYGHDAGGVKPPDPPTARNFLPFLLEVVNGATSNGVGPCQVTWAGSLRSGHRDGGYFREMAERGLMPWDPRDNMVFGFGLMAAHKRAGGTWRAAGTAYNGKASYGEDYLRKCNEWRRRLGVKGSVK